MDKRKPFEMDLQLFADGDPKPADPNGGDPKPGEEPKEPEGKTVSMTQEQFDKTIQKRLDQARRAWEKEAEDAKTKANMGEVERLKAEKAESDKKAQEAERRAALRELNADAKILAAELGCRPDRVGATLKLADLSGAINDKNEVDGAALKAAVEEVLKAMPEFKGETPALGGGSNPGGGGSPEENPWAKETFNLTKQGEIVRKDPDRAKRLREAAKKKGK